MKITDELKGPMNELKADGRGLPASAFSYWIGDAGESRRPCRLTLDGFV